MSRDRLLIIDADCPSALAPMLESRGRRAVTASKLKLAQGVKDGPLLRALAAQFNGVEDWVLITGDDGMPNQHAAVIRETEATVAVIHPDRPATMTQHAWRIDVVQRFAHAMQEQEPQSVRRYTDKGSKIWTPRRRHIFEAGRMGWVPWTPRPEPGEPEPPAEPPPRPPDRLPGLE